MKKRNFKRIISLGMAALMAGITIASGTPVAKQAEAENVNPIISITQNPVTGATGYIVTCNKSVYYPNGYGYVEIDFTYNSLANTVEETIDEKVVEKATDFNDTFELVVFDTKWEGWNATTIGPNGYDVVKGSEKDVIDPTDEDAEDTYTVTIPVSVVESKLNTGRAVQGFNLQTGTIGGTSVTINSFKYVAGGIKSEPTILEGAWHRTDLSDDSCGSINLTQGFAVCYANGWNLPVTGFSVADFVKPIVAVTVEYENVTEPFYPQSEVLNAAGQPIKPNYPEVSESGAVTYLTNIPKDTTSMTLAYNKGTVTKVEIYDEAENYFVKVNDLTSEDIIAKLGAGWNLGNALESTTDKKVGETLWGNPTVNKRLFKLVKEAGYSSVRIPFSCISAVNVNGTSITVDSTELAAILNRLEEVVKMALDYDLFVIIDLHHDGSEGVDGMWLDIESDNQGAILKAFDEIWFEIADKFADYDQHVIFEGMNEVMEKGNYSTPKKDNTWKNINALNQLFVNTVRNTDGKNLKRFLVVPGYNTNIDQTVSGNFILPTDSSADKDHPTGYIMVDAHYYDPYEFTLKTDEGSRTNITDAELEAIGTKFASLKNKFGNTPVIIGEFAALDKGNYADTAKYINKVIEQAKTKGLGYFYWDNGYTGENGSALWNRYTYARTSLYGVDKAPLVQPEETEEAEQ